jgi:O-antigen/teichoic acid export membrane protein
MGAAAGIVVGIFVSLIYSMRYFSSRNRDNHSWADMKPLALYSIPVVVQSVANTSFFTTDVILVKHYLSGFDAGIYASLSTMGKIIIFATLPVVSAMFPLVSRRHSKGQTYFKIFIFGLLLTAGICSVILLLFGLLSNFLVGVFFGANYLQSAKWLLLFGITISLFSLGNYIINFFLSVNKTNVSYFALTAAAMQIVGITLFHSDLNSVIIVSFGVSLALLCLLICNSLAYYRHS